MILASASALFSFAGGLFATSSTETAVANGDTRTLHFYHTHTGESIDATFRVDGHYDPAVLRQLNHFLRDWRNNDEINMDPRLFDTLWEVYRTAGATDRIQIYSAYRSPETNAMLRRRSRAVAEHSQHMLGKAMDTTIPGFPMHLIREVGMKLQRGGVGWYPTMNFVHLDVGGVRSWPRMPYDQLASLFPDGKTVHIASNGQVLPGYEAARAEIASRGGTEVPPSQESGGFFAWLFGGGSSGSDRGDEEDRTTAVAAAAPPPAPRVQQAIAYAAPEQPTVQLASARAPAIDEEQIGVRAEPQRQPERTQVASLETSGTVDDGAPRADIVAEMPLPPRRPSELAVAEVEIPLPPVRPNALTPAGSVHFVEATQPGKDAIGGLIAASRKGPLPAIITQGDRGHPQPKDAMAFAETPSEFAFHPPPMPVARPQLVKPVGLRSGLRNDRKHVADATADSAAEAPVGSGPRLTGLRRAAHLMAEKASL